MSNGVERLSRDTPPTAEQIATYRKEAAKQESSVEVTFPTNDETKRIVVSPRGTVVLLNDVSEETFNQSESAEDIAAALPR